MLAVCVLNSFIIAKPRAESETGHNINSHFFKNSKKLFVGRKEWYELGFGCSTLTHILGVILILGLMIRIIEI